jgi:disulfide bond formation protein DsbB
MKAFRHDRVDSPMPLPMTFQTRTDRLLWPLLALVSALVALASIALTVWLDLSPCHLCIFQRLLFMLLALLAVAAIPRNGFGLLAGGLFAVVAVAGVATAGYQSWLQLQPPDAVTCIGGEMGLIERLVEWLGMQWPSLFMATGFCDDKGLLLFGLSLANGALILFAGILAAALWMLYTRARTLRPV